MLDGAGDADGDVQLGGDYLAGLPHLHVVGHEAGVDRRARGAHRGTELVGHLVEQLEVVAVLQAAAAGDDDLRRGQLGTLGLRQLRADEAGNPVVLATGQGLDRGAAAGGGHRVEASGAHTDDLHRRAGLHGGDGVAGVDRPLEGVGTDDPDDFRDLLDVEQRGDPRQDVLAVAGGRGQHVAVGAAQLGQQRREVLRQLVGVGRGVGDQHLAHPGDLGRGGGHRATALAGDQQVDVAADLAGGREGVEGGRGQRGIVVLGEYQDSHQITFASFFSLSTSSATDPTLMPALRAAGASTLSTFTVEAVDTPSASGVSTSSGFFLAFMMLGKEA